MSAELHGLGRGHKLLIHGAGDVIVLGSREIELQLTSREMASMVERWLTYKLARDGHLPAVVPVPPDGSETRSADQRAVP